MFSRRQTRRLMVVSALMLLPFVLSGVRASTAPSASTTVYLPFVAKDVFVPIGLRVVQHTFTDAQGANYDTVYGQVETTLATPFSDVVLAMPVTQGTCFEVDPCWYTVLPPEIITPAFGITLPNQPNPYRSSTYMQYKDFFLFGTVRVSNGHLSTPDMPASETLAVVNIQRNPGTPSMIQGVVRNDTDHVLIGARVVVYIPDVCPWEEATLATTMLDPGQEVAFQLTSQYRGPSTIGCRNATPQAVGQASVRE